MTGAQEGEWVGCVNECVVRVRGSEVWVVCVMAEEKAERRGAFGCCGL